MKMWQALLVALGIITLILAPIFMDPNPREQCTNAGYSGLEWEICVERVDRGHQP